MQPNLSLTTKRPYKKESQKIRVISEDWAFANIFCPNCGDSINHHENNKPVADFYCQKCYEDFELKAKKGKFGNKVIGGSYDKIIEKINSNKKPNFFFLSYLESNYFVENFFTVPKYFIIPEIIEKRKALSARPNYYMSNILFSRIPKAGQIYYIENGKEIAKKDVLEKWQKTVFLKQIKKTEAKGWILDIMNCIDSLNKTEFSLSDLYQFENDLKKLHPENNNIKAKIRQQLQILRDKNYLKFQGEGFYTVN